MTIANSRNEVFGQFYAGDGFGDLHSYNGIPYETGSPSSLSLSANGFSSISKSYGPRWAGGQAPATTFDAYAGRLISTTQTQAGEGRNTTVTTSTGVVYDASGRMYQKTSTSVSKYGAQVTNSCGDTDTRQYDAENHLTQITLAGIAAGSCAGSSPFSYAYQWGPDGHVAQMGNNCCAGYWVHWDGDAPLFVTDSTGALQQINVGRFAEITPAIPNFASAGFTVIDSDWSGFGVAERGVQSMTFGNPVSGAQFQPAVAGHPFGPGPLFFSGSDGITDGQNVVQGVRSFDPGIGTWTTPDAYKGEIHDPMSQRPYMWNRNNPYQYADPSGYCVEDLCIGEMLLTGAAIRIATPVLARVAVPALGVATRVAVQVTNRQLGNLVNQVFRAADTTPGGTAGAIRAALSKGEYDAGHVTKATDRINELNNLLGGKGGALSAAETKLAIAIKEDLEAAVSAAKALLPK